MSDVVHYPSVYKHPNLYRATKRSYRDIVSRLAQIRAKDYYGYESADLLAYLPWSYARPFIRVQSGVSAWSEHYPVLNPPLAEALLLLPRAWDAANGKRGLSVLRNMEHFKAFFWLGGYDEGVCAHFDDYEYFGKPQLVLASEVLGFDWQTHDDKKWLNGATPLSEESRLNAAYVCANIALSLRSSELTEV